MPHGVNDRWCGYGESRVGVTATASYIVEVREPGVVRETGWADEEHLIHATRAHDGVLMVEDMSLDLQVEESRLDYYEP